MSLAQGTRPGPYEVVAPLGAGGMGKDHEWGSDRPKSFRCFRLAVCCRSEAALYWLLGIFYAFEELGSRDSTRLRKTGRIGHTKASVRAENISMWLGLNSLYRSGPDQAQAVV